MKGLISASSKMDDFDDDFIDTVEAAIARRNSRKQIYKPRSSFEFINKNDEELTITGIRGDELRIETSAPIVYKSITIAFVDVVSIRIINIKTNKLIIKCSDISSSFEIENLEANTMTMKNLRKMSKISFDNIQANRLNLTEAFRMKSAEIIMKRISVKHLVLNKAFKTRFETRVRFEDCDIKSAETEEAFTTSLYAYKVNKKTLVQLHIDDDEKLVKAFFTRDELEKLKEYGRIFRDLVRAGIISLPYCERNAKEVEAIYNSMDRIKKLIEYKLEKK